MFYKKSTKDYQVQLNGVKFKTLVFGEKTMLCEFRLERGAQIPLHSHQNEQTGYLVSGKMSFTIGNEQFVAEPGCSWNIPSNVEHGVSVLEPSVVIEIFSPLREDYLPSKNKI